MSIILQRTSFKIKWAMPKEWRKWATGVKLLRIRNNKRHRRKNATTPAMAGYHETLTQRKNWGSVHHTSYILPLVAEKVK